MELINARGAVADYQILKLVADILHNLGVKDFTFNLNYLGIRATQERYKEKLKLFLAETNPDLCSDCQHRVNLNSLRTLDCQLCPKKFSFPPYRIA